MLCTGVQGVAAICSLARAQPTDGGSGITGELVRDEEAQAPPQTPPESDSAL